MNTGVDALEREVEASRSRLEAALGVLQDRLHPASVADELIGIGRRSGAGGDIYDLALDTVRRNPVPVLLACAGVALLLSRAGRGLDSRAPDQSSASGRGSGMPQRRRAARVYPT